MFSIYFYVYLSIYQNLEKIKRGEDKKEYNRYDAIGIRIDRNRILYNTKLYKELSWIESLLARLELEEND